MRGKFYSQQIKNRIGKLRSRGVTYSELRKSFGVPKSTLSNWLGEKYKGIFDREAQLKHLAKVRPAALAAVQKRIEDENQKIKEKVKQEFPTYPVNHPGLQRSILATLYWAEGSKYEKVSGLGFANTDPKIIKLFISLLRKCFNVNESRLRIRLHLHYYHKIKTCKKFWSDLTKIPIARFRHTFIKKRSRKKRFRKNFMGICFVYYFDSKIRKELLELCDQMYKWFEK